jgi:hypothetical protein
VARRICLSISDAHQPLPSHFVCKVVGTRRGTLTLWYSPSALLLIVAVGLAACLLPPAALRKSIPSSPSATNKVSKLGGFRIARLCSPLLLFRQPFEHSALRAVERSVIVHREDGFVAFTNERHGLAAFCIVAGS